MPDLDLGNALQLELRDRGLAPRLLEQLLLAAPPHPDPGEENQQDEHQQENEEEDRLAVGQRDLVITLVVAFAHGGS